MKLNVAGPAIVAQNFMPLLERAAAGGGKKPVVCNMSSGMGSIAMDLGDRLVSYSISKSAVNMLVRICSVYPCNLFLPTRTSDVQASEGEPECHLDCPGSRLGQDWHVALKFNDNCLS